MQRRGSFGRVERTTKGEEILFPAPPQLPIILQIRQLRLTEILALARPQKTSTLQAKALIALLTHVMSYYTQDGLKGYFLS